MENPSLHPADIPAHFAMFPSSQWVTIKLLHSLNPASSILQPRRPSFNAQGGFGASRPLILYWLRYYHVQATMQMFICIAGLDLADEKSLDWLFMSNFGAWPSHIIVASIGYCRLSVFVS